MAIDTENKRRGASGIPGVPIAPKPDGEIDQADRQQISGVYPGIPAGDGLPNPPIGRYAEAAFSTRSVEIGFRAKRKVSIEYRGI